VLLITNGIVNIVFAFGIWIHFKVYVNVSAILSGTLNVPKKCILMTEKLLWFA